MKLKMWIGNLDGKREGLVIAPTKKRATEIVGGSLKNFNDYWRERPVDPSLEPEVLYTRPFATGLRDPVTPWFKGRCPL